MKELYYVVWSEELVEECLGVYTSLNLYFQSTLERKLISRGEAIRMFGINAVKTAEINAW